MHLSLRLIVAHTMLASIGGLPAIMQDRVRIHGRATAEVIDIRETPAHAA